MPFIKDIKKYRSISTIGLEKNVGKTVTMNYIIKRLVSEGVKVGITSVGVDGETMDVVTTTAKPEVTIYEGMMFATSENHYKMKRFQGDILSVSEKATALGRVVIGKVLREGKILLSGPSNSKWVKETIEELLEKGMDTVIIDGALSRMSIGSPIVTDGIILSTGGAVSINLNEVIKKTKHVIKLIDLDEISSSKREVIEKLDDGIYKIVWEREEVEKLPIKSILSFSQLEQNVFQEECSLYITGAVTERFLDNISKQNFIKNVEVIVTDFTKIFSSTEVLNRFLKKGGRIKVLLKTNLIGVTVNPTSPAGYILNSEELIKKIKEFTNVPVVNLKEDGYVF
nr:hypothetical protein [uncultured Cetobacterium sp.]